MQTGQRTTFPEKIRASLLTRNLKPLEILFLTFLLLWGFTRNIEAVNFFPDESFWVVSSVRFDKFITGDFASRIWTDPPLIAYEVRPMPGYLTGISQRLGGISAESLPPYWDWGFTKEKNIALGAMPTQEQLWWSRLPMATLSALSILFVAIFLAKSHSRLSAYLFALISFNGYFLLNLRRAMSEASILFFTVLVMFASYQLMNAARQKITIKSIQWSLIVGLFCGLAGESKLTGLVCAGIPILGVVLVLLPRPVQWLTILKQRMLLIIVFIVTITMLTTFIASYPLFYRNTFDQIAETLSTRRQIVDYQLATYPEEVIPSNYRIEILFQRIFDYPIHAPGIIFHWINLTIFIFGITYAIKHASQQDIHIVLLLGTLLCAAPMLLTPFDWERYYLFPIFFQCIFFAIGASQLTFTLTHGRKPNE